MKVKYEKKSQAAPTWAHQRLLSSEDKLNGETMYVGTYD